MKIIRVTVGVFSLLAAMVGAQERREEILPDLTLQQALHDDPALQNEHGLTKIVQHDYRNAPISSLLLLLNQTLPQTAATPAAANWVSAINAYQEADYEQARQQFKQLIELGNVYAMRALGQMAQQGIGQQPNMVEALTYFYLGGIYDDVSEMDNARALASTLTDSERVTALTNARAMAATFKVTPSTRNTSNNRYLIKNAKPIFGRKVVKGQLFGYANVRNLIGRDGKVLVTEVLDTLPANLYEKNLVSFYNRIRYNPADSASIMISAMDIQFTPGLHVQKFTELMQQNNLWHNASQGQPSAQYQLSRLLKLSNVQSSQVHTTDPATFLQLKQPDFAAFNSPVSTYIKLGLFTGLAEVNLNDAGVITKVYQLKNSQQTEADIIGTAVVKGLPAGRYQLQRLHSQGIDYGYVQVAPILSVPISYMSNYWSTLAAENGHLPSQQILSWQHSGWLAYLAQQQDPSSLAWFGAQQVIDGNAVEGMANIEKAIALGYAVGKQLKAALANY